MTDNAGVTCPSCGSRNDSSHRFCAACGVRLARTCAACGAVLPPAARFCPECGRQVGAAGDRPGEAGPGALEQGRDTSPGPGGGALTERRLVSVLFADLVGFTTLAEREDPEAVRETLDRYFRGAADIVGRYGGTVEKFIGDAVMAVWGAPTAHEDDAERAVRAALELVDAVHGPAMQAPDAGRLSVRAAVATGEAAVTVGATGQGMVTGDIVNTASRLQSVAAPDTVVVGEGTYRAARDSVAFEPLGTIALRGKADGVPAWRASRIIAQRRGAGRTGQLEAPFVGREEELRLLKEMLAATGRERRARLVSVVGQAGIGKSRLAWEFLKYVDGLVEPIYWHQGRSLAYGTGISFWALGEMVRGRAGIGEGDEAGAAAQKLSAMVLEYLPGPEERSWVEPRLAALLGLAEAPEGGRDELFAAWRTLFQRIAELGTTVLVFEDLQWADQALLEFVDELVDWARTSPILVVTLARPELLERRPNWGIGQRSFVSIGLESLDRAQMGGLLAGLVPGLPPRAVEAIIARADGVPLYAVELVRMLITDGRLEETADGYRPIGDLASLAVPETLQALVTARLDALDPLDRALLQTAAVLGTTFSTATTAAISGHPLETVDARFRALARRELLVLDVDPRSPTRGQYGFVQALTRDVAYGNLGRRERRALHLAAAREIEGTGDEELSGILASHFVAAYRAVPDGPEAEAIATQARVALRAAATRSAALADHESALVATTEALAITADPAEAAALRERIADHARNIGRYDAAETHAREALGQFRRLGDLAGAARASFRLALVQIETMRIAEAVETLQEAIRDQDLEQPTPDLVAAVATLGRAYMNLGRADRGLEWADRAIALAERANTLRPLVDAIITRAWAVEELGRHREALAIAWGALHLADRWSFVEEQLRVRNNIASLEQDAVAGRRLFEEALELARRHGLRGWTRYFEAALIALRMLEGDWDAVLSDIADDDDTVAVSMIERIRTRALIAAYRGEHAAMHVALRELEAQSAGTTKVNDLAQNRMVAAQAALAEGRLEAAWETASSVGQADTEFGEIWFLKALIAFRLRDASRMEAVVAGTDGMAGDDFRGAIGEAVRGYAALLAGLQPEAAGHLAAAREVFVRQRDLPNEALATAALVAALGEGSDDGRQMADELRGRLQALRAAWLLSWLDDVRAWTGAARTAVDVGIDRRGRALARPAEAG